MTGRSGKRTAKLKLTLTERAVDALEPADKPWIAWDDKISGFGVRVQPTGARYYIVNYRIRTPRPTTPSGEWSSPATAT